MNFKLNQNEQAVLNKMMADLPQVLQEGLFYETRDLFDLMGLLPHPRLCRYLFELTAAGSTFFKLKGTTSTIFYNNFPI